MAFADKVAQAPDGPGVYLLKDAKGKVLYVGKARSLRERLRSYTQPQESPRLRSLVSRITDLETVITRSEVEALVLEENFIKFKKPRYNVRLRDDKKFPYLKITTGEAFPRIYVTRNLRDDTALGTVPVRGQSPAKSVFFGPYTSARELRKALRGVKRIFRLRTCKREIAAAEPDDTTAKTAPESHHQDTETQGFGRSQNAEARVQKLEVEIEKSNRQGRQGAKAPEIASRQSPIANPQYPRPCLNFELNRCTAPCAGKVTQEQYGQQVKDVIRFLSGRSDELTEQVERRMWAASQAQDFEVAAGLRDQLMALREIRKDQQAVMQDKTSRDIIGLARGARAAVAALFRVREGKIVSREEYPLTIGEDAPDSEILSTVTRSIHTHTHDIPDEIILPSAIDDAEVLEALFAEKRGRKVRIVVPERGDKVRLTELARANAEKALVELRPEERVPVGNRELAEILGLATVPRMIEGVDISNTQGTNAVGSIVVFRDDRPAKQQYRLFKIRGGLGHNPKSREDFGYVPRPDDCAMMEEVLSRRVRGLLEKNRPLPDLVLVDGGRGQLSSAVKAYSQVDANIPILGLAKRTDTLYYNDGREITIPVTSPALKLLKRIRDESHRFAITFHRKLRGKKMVESELDEISGLGPMRKKVLIQHFGSLDKVRLASVEEIAKVKGFGPSLSEKVFRELHAG
ncbi:MAG: excinuclease ABC subunit UvrC [candidate division WOR-3 bacterium]|nr:excinuclease ABC subunit UvrC [candidate division WOR-3 bacterium]